MIIGSEPEGMPVTVSERRIDDKRRVTMPANFVPKLKEGARVVVISFDNDAVIVASDRRVADELSSLLGQSEIKRKLRALDEWENFVENAELSKLTTKKIDRAVERSIRRPKKLNG